MSCVIGLVALAAGYLVFSQASKEKEGLRLLGQVIGIVVMIGALMSGFCAIRHKMAGSGCPFSKPSMCHFSPKMAENEMHEHE